MRSIPLAEQETIIRWAADEKTASISTANPVVIRKLDKLTQTTPEAYTKQHDLDDTHDARYTVPVNLIRFAKPVSDEYREKLRQRALESGRRPPQAVKGQATRQDA